MPYLLNQRAPRLDSYRVGREVIKGYTQLSPNVYLSPDYRTAYWASPLKNKFVIHAKATFKPNGDNLQVVFVDASINMKNRGCAQEIYKAVAKIKPIVSSDTHMEGGKQLWVTLAQDSECVVTAHLHNQPTSLADAWGISSKHEHTLLTLRTK